MARDGVNTLRKLVIALLIFISSICNAMNFGDINTISRAIARDPIPTNGTPRVGDTIVSSYINIAVQETAMFTWCLEGTTTINIVSGQREYNFTSDMVAVKRLYIDGVQIQSTSKVALDNVSHGTWQTNFSTSTPNKYYAENGIIGFNSIPDSTISHVITVSYIQIPDTLVNNTDIPFNSVTRYSQFHMAICYYTAALICYNDNRATEGDRYYNMYLARVQNMSSTIRLSPDFYPTMGGSSTK
jgi:hypothetical protein